MPTKKASAKSSKTKKPASAKPVPAKKAAPGQKSSAKSSAKLGGKSANNKAAGKAPSKTSSADHKKDHRPDHKSAGKEVAKKTVGAAVGAKGEKSADKALPKTSTKAAPDSLVSKEVTVAATATSATVSKPAGKDSAKTAATAATANLKRPEHPEAKMSLPKVVAIAESKRKPAAAPADGEDVDTEGMNLLAGPRNVTPYQPKRGEQYMNKEQLDHFRQILSTWKRDLMEEVDRTVLHMKDEAANFPDPNDRATQESEFSLELRTRDRERKLIRKIDEAIARIDDGSYGYCVETGEEIGIKRLEARPVATLCVEAQERRERREKQYGDRDDRYR